MGGGIQVNIIGKLDDYLKKATNDTSGGAVDSTIVEVYNNRSTDDSSTSPQLKKLQEVYQKENSEVKECLVACF